MTLEIIRSDALSSISHGFFTRKGGVSSGIYAGLNCGTGSNDDPNSISENRQRVAQAFGLESICGVHQIHSNIVETRDAPTDNRPKADAMVTNQKGVALGILTADCQPVLFADRQSGVIGAAHAGWRGAMDGILENTVDAMKALGARAENIHAVIGPCISQSAYEVGPEFMEDFVAQDPLHARFFANGTGDRYMFDLPSFGLSRLRDAGVGTAEWTGHCTYRDEERFFSYRRTTHRKEPDYGRLISVVMLP